MSRKNRSQRLENPQSGISVSFSADILLAAQIMLGLALEDRKDNRNPPQNNHQSKHSIGSILLLIAGFESWLNESLAYLSAQYESKLRERGKDGTLGKYKYLCEWCISPHTSPINQKEFDKIEKNLYIALEVRNEIAHAMPLPTGYSWDLPPELIGLHTAGLLITTGNEKSDYSLPQKLRSYALAYWCWEVVNNAIEFIIKQLKPDINLAWTAQNFSAYKELVCSPEDLAKYDAGEWHPKHQ